MVNPNQKGNPKKEGKPKGKSKGKPKPNDQSRVSQPVSGIGNLSQGNVSQMQTDQNSTTCEACKVYIEESWLVQCSECDKWFHYNCANYSGDTDEEVPWYCIKCSEKRMDEVSQAIIKNISQANCEEIQDNETDQTKNNPAGEIDVPLPIENRSKFTRQQESNSDDLVKSMVDSFTKWKSMRNPSLPIIDPHVRITRINEILRNAALNSKSQKEQNREPNQQAPVAADGEGQVYKKVQQTSNHTGVHGIENAEQSVNESQQKSNLVEPLHQTPSLKDTTMIPIPRNTNRPTILADGTQLNAENTISKGSRSVGASTNKTRSTSSRTTMSSQCRARLEQQRLEEELKLQEKLDEERIALKLEALRLKESREKKFLEDKFKSMNGDMDGLSSHGSSRTSRSSKHSQLSKDVNQTSQVLAWIESQRRQKSQIAKENPEFSITIDDEEMEKIMQNDAEKRRDSQMVNNAQFDQYAQLNAEADPFITSGQVGNYGVENPSSNYKQPNTMPQHNDELPEYQNIVVPHLDQQNVRVNSTLIQNHQPETLHSDQRVRFMQQQGQQDQHYKVQGTSNDYHQSNTFNVQGSQSKPSYQQNPFNPSANQYNQNTQSTHQGQNFQNTPRIPSQPNVSSSDQQYSRSAGRENFQSHQRIPIPTSNQSGQGFTNDYQQNTNVQGTGIQTNSQSLSSSYNFVSQRSPLTPAQIAARHVISKKLPLFYGNPAQWPDFIQKFIRTTDACGFDNTENLDRLSDCLKGKAHTIVRSQLSRPECVPSIIQTLEQKWGRKELVVKAILTEIRAEPPIKADKLEALSDYGYKVQNACHTIQSQNMDFYLHNPELVQELVDKLPHQTKIDWARYTANMSQVTLSTLSEWLIELSRSLNRITIPEIPSYVGDRRNDRRSDNTKGTYLNAHGNNKTTSSDQSRSKCEYCSKGCKTLAECFKFKGTSIDEKWKFLYEHKKICRVCFKAHGRKCTEPKDCGVNGCSYKHHPMLHNDEKLLKSKSNNQSSAQPTNQSSAQPTNEPNPSCNAHASNQSILYKIIPVTLKNGDRMVTTLAYMDDGSGLTLMESELAEELNLKGTPQKLCLRWTSGTIRNEKESMRVVLGISGEGENKENYQMRDVRTVKSLDLPSQIIDKELLTKKYSYLARIPFQNFEGAPRILIGLDNVKLGLARECVEGKWTEPVATKTLLGWVVHGQNGPRSQDEIHDMQYHVLNINQCLCQADRDEEIHQKIEEFFSLENFGVRAITSPVESKDVQRAIKIMEKTTVRKNNRFETGLLWKFDDVNLPNNYEMAVKRLECQDRRMQANPELMENINSQIQDFVKKGYARKLTVDEKNVDDPRIWYLPVFHHLDPKKPGKVRLVWDAAAKYKGVSLNSMLTSGPDNLVASIDILRRFREKSIAIGGDIEEMFHQVGVIPKDRNSQRFLWRNGKMDAIPDVYIMDVLTFGTNCSPSLAQNVKNKNASEFETQYPQAVKAIKENHYVDDWLESQHTVEDAIRLAKEVKYVHRQGGFNLRKFTSNSAEVLKALGEENGQNSKDLNVTMTLSTQKILGMWWEAQTDCFTYSLKYTKLNEEVLFGLRSPTKRELLQTLMSIFDPLGLIAFFLVYLKMLLQEVWKARLAWDEPIPDNLNEKWKKWIKLLPSVEKLHIPRLYSSKISPGTAQSIELHTFVDASENAYCAVCFLRIIDEEGVDCVLVGAKTKVAQIKPLLTIPRLELLAAVLGVRLAKSIQESLTLTINKRYFWSDSRDVLCWVRSTTRKYRQFVAFRVGEILESTSENEWRWVPGKLNPADDGTKWSKTPNFDENCRWFRGPEFIYGDESSWPEDLSASETTEEELHIHLSISKTESPTQIDPERFSNWSRIVNAQALSSRYLKQLVAKAKGQSIRGPITTNEYKEAEYKLYRLAQFDGFYDEIMTLSTLKEEFGPKSYVKKSSSIFKRSPYIDEDDLLRVRGRIDNMRNIKFDTKRPIILPGKHKITELVVNNFHRMYLHRNDETVINELNQRFYIPKLRVVLSKVIKNCQLCKNRRAKPIVPEMGDLPIARLSPEFRVFTHTGVDYFGPMKVVVKRSTEKRWGVLFTCLTVRAIHIEIVPSLTADSCILAIRNFTCLRGTPAEFHSDNGTHFTAADKELKQEFEKMDKEKIQSHYTRSYTTWNFIPPASPHMGGAWERLIGVVKNNLKMVMFTRTPKEELLRSYLNEIVNIVNSRPLTYLQLESSEDEALTPNHFIFGTSNGNKAPGEFPYEEKSLTKSWRRSQELTNKFWRRWIKEYLPTLTCRTKWFPKAKPVKVGDVVLLVDEQNDRNSYPKGIVVEALPDKHGQVRQATVKVTEVITDAGGRTKDAPVRISIKTRPVAKLAVLDVAGKGDDVKPVGAPTTKGLNGEENITDGNTGPISADNVTTDLSPATGRRSSDRLKQKKSNRMA